MKQKYIYFKIRSFWPLVVLNMLLVLLIRFQEAYLVIDAVKDSYNPAIDYLLWFTAIVAALYFGVWPIVEDMAGTLRGESEEPEERLYSVTLPDGKVLNNRTLAEIELILQNFKGKRGQGSPEYWEAIRKQFSGVSSVIVMHANNQVSTAKTYEKNNGTKQATSPSPTVEFSL